MKQYWFIYLLLVVGCKDTVVNTPKAEQKEVVTNKVVEATSKDIYKQDIIKIVDYEGLAPLLASKNDTTYVVNFWATWCKPCVKELPYFETINEEYKDKKVKVVLVSLDFPKMLEKQVVPYVKKNLKSEVWLLNDKDANGWIPKVDKTWSGAIPATIIYNKNNRMFYEHSFTYEELKTEVESIL